MKIHYFQRYHSKENVATANTMLLLSRLYSYSPNKFFLLLKTEFFSDDFKPEIEFELQKKSENSIPDATITQGGFKIVVETKLSDWFYSDQLLRHLESFNDEKCKVMITLAPEPMADEKLSKFQSVLKEYNTGKSSPVIHINTTFENLANAINKVIDDRDYEMQEILDDYLDYCYTDELITVSDAWKIMRVRLAGTTFDFNMREGVYYDSAEHGFRPHDYLGLYRNKSVRAIGKVCARIVAIPTAQGMEYDVEYGELTDERKQKIHNAIKDAVAYGYDLSSIKHRYFFVDQFYETDFKKSTLYPPRGTRIFDLSAILEMSELPSSEEIAELLKNKTWE